MEDGAVVGMTTGAAAATATKVAMTTTEAAAVADTGQCLSIFQLLVTWT